MNEIYSKIKLNEIFERGLRESHKDSKVSILYNGERFGIAYGCGIQEDIYYIQAFPINSENKAKLLNAGHILQIIDLQKENAILEYKNNYSYDVDDFENFLIGSIEDGNISDIVNLNSIGFFLDKKEVSKPFYRRFDEAVFLDSNLNYIRGKDSLNNDTIMFIFEELKKD